MEDLKLTEFINGKHFISKISFFVIYVYETE